jgi:hypothetical protein
MVRPTLFEDIPSYLTSVTIVEPRGNVAAEVAAAVNELAGYKILPLIGPLIIKVLGLAAVAFCALYLWWNADALDNFQRWSSDGLTLAEQNNI